MEGSEASTHCVMVVMLSKPMAMTRKGTSSMAEQGCEQVGRHK